jgi:hypothetical protein
MANSFGSDATPSPRPAAGTPEFVAWRRSQMQLQPGPIGLEGPAHAPVGHAYGVVKSTSITSNYRRLYRKNSMDVQPDQVAQALINAKIETWVLMGLHGYVGYMNDPRATQDVDVMVPYALKDQAAEAISRRWPALQQHELEMVIRFSDPGELDQQGKPKPVVDLMLPWSKFQEIILAEHIVVDPQTGHHLPTLEAALVSKYAAMVSSYRARARKSYDAGDFRVIVLCNRDRIDVQVLRELADAIWEGGGDEIETFLDVAIRGEQFEL